jgi:nitrogenase molybdenum-iron protein NifN
MTKLAKPQAPVSTTNACRMCMPLGACLAFAGMERTLPFLHGSQGCSTYMRRYLISHFNEPLDIASSSFGEASTIFGGEGNLRAGLANVQAVYQPDLIGVATTCLTETIGEDTARLLRQIAGEDGDLPALVFVPTPSFAGTHTDGYQAAIGATIAALAEGGPRGERLALLPGIVSAADLRHLRELVAAFGIEATLLPDYSDTLDGPATADYHKLPPGGTPLEAIRALGRSAAAIALGGLAAPGVKTGATVLEERFATPVMRLPLPIGVRLTDRFLDALGELVVQPSRLLAGGTPAPQEGKPLPESLAAERGRLIDAYVDGHKYLSGKRAVVFGDDDLVVGLAAFLAEIGVQPVVCAGGGRTGKLREAILDAAPELEGRITVLEDTDFERIGAAAEEAAPDLFVGHSKGYHLARRLELPLIRVGLPIHDRLGGQRIAHLGYRGAQQLFDRIVNTLLERAQDASPVGYSYM